MSLSEYSCKICVSEVKDTDSAVMYDLREIGDILIVRALGKPNKKA